MSTNELPFYPITYCLIKQGMPNYVVPIFIEPSCPGCRILKEEIEMGIVGSVLLFMIIYSQTLTI